MFVLHDTAKHPLSSASAPSASPLLIQDTAILPKQPEILEALAGLEKTHGITILFAIESGSRITGLAGPDSDFDIRFIFVRNVSDYLSLQQPRDTIEHTHGPLDMSGWDLRKALTLMQQSNTALLEWIRSPAVYKDPTGMIPKLAQLAEPCVDLSTCRLHYLGMAKDHLQEIERSKTSCQAKNYLYAARGILSATWIDLHRSPPPLRFPELCAILDNIPISKAIDLCRTSKIQFGERSIVNRNYDLEDYLLERNKALFLPIPKRDRTDFNTPFSEFFYNTVISHDRSCSVIV
jgi:predicted nucleotidyltransferase